MSKSVTNIAIPDDVVFIFSQQGGQKCPGLVAEISAEVMQHNLVLENTWEVIRHSENNGKQQKASSPIRRADSTCFQGVADCHKSFTGNKRVNKHRCCLKHQTNWIQIKGAEYDKSGQVAGWVIADDWWNGKNDQ